MWDNDICTFLLLLLFIIIITLHKSKYSAQWDEICTRNISFPILTLQIRKQKHADNFHKNMKYWWIYRGGNLEEP